MNRWHAFKQLLLSRLREFYREPEVLFWVYGFPVLLAVALGIAFMGKAPDAAAVDVQQSSAAIELKKLLDADKLVVEIHDETTCRQRLREGKTALFVVSDGTDVRFVLDERRPESVSARHQVEAILLRAKAGPSVPRVEVETTDDPGSRYIDFLLPGLMGMNLMGGGLWGVGFVIVDLRVRKLLKRLLATPMRRDDFLLAIMTARLVFMLPEIGLLLLVGWLGFGVPLRGDPLTMLVVIFMGAAAFSGLGLFVACRADKIETASGLMNLVMMPMWILSGTFFSAKRFPDVVQPFVQALPLTQLNDALREVMLEGAALPQVGWRLAILAAWAVIPFALALRWFRWL